MAADRGYLVLGASGLGETAARCLAQAVRAAMLGSPASLHQFRNKLPKPAVENGLPPTATRKVKLSPGVAAKIWASAV